MHWRHDPVMLASTCGKCAPVGGTAAPYVQYGGARAKSCTTAAWMASRLLLRRIIIAAPGNGARVRFGTDW